MEARLFLIAVIAFIFAKAGKFLKKKGFLENRKILAAWCGAFALLAGGMVFYLFNFMASNGVAGGLSAGKAAFIILAALVFAGYNIRAALAGDNKTAEKLFASDLDWAETVYFAGFFASVAMFFFVQAFKIPSASMRNTLLEGDNLFVNKITYGVRLPFMDKKLFKFKDIERGDIIVFAFPADSREQINCGEPQYGRDFVKRVLALPGETVEIKNKIVYINADPLPEQPYALYSDHPRSELSLPFPQEEYQQLWEGRQLEDHLGLYLRDYFGPVVVPAGTYLGIGDNRDFSCDSRFWGPVPERNIKGKAWLRHWPINRFGKIM